MEETTTPTAAPVSPQPRVLGTSLSDSLRAGDSGEREQTAGFDDIFAPPETESDPADDSTSEPEPPAATEEKPVVQAEEPPAPASDDLIAQLAAEYGLNPADPKHQALLAKMAAQQSAAQEQQGAEQTFAADDEYEKLEKAIFADEAQPAAQPPAAIPQGQQQPPGPPPLPPGKFGDILDDTNTMDEAMERWSQAWTPDDDGKIDLKRAGAIMNAFFVRQFSAIAMPAVHNAISMRMQHDLGDAIAFFRQQSEEGHRAQLYKGVIEKMSHQNGYEKIGELFEPLSDKTIKVRSMDASDTRINRILQSNPWILNIEMKDQNPDKALQKTHLARLQAVMAQHKKSEAAVPIKDARKLVESGAEIERKKQSTAARQQLNAGTGATSAGAGEKSDDDAWFDRILKSNGGQMRVSDLTSHRR